MVKMLLKYALVALACIIAANGIPVEDEVGKVNEDIERSANEYRGIEEDKSPFDEIAKINSENDLTGLYEGDIQLVPGATKSADVPGGKEGLVAIIKEKRNVINSKEYLWTSKVVPYTILSELSNIKDLIKMALDEISKKSCIKFVPKTNERYYLEFYKDKGCFSFVGRMYNDARVNRISLGDGCNRKGIIIHEVLHALGFWHEQSRSDRDSNVEIFWENIQSGMESNFAKNTQHESLSNYDYGSIMHYGTYAFSANGKKTIVPINNPTASIGQRDELSAKDITELNALYDCQSTSTDFYSTWGNWAPCDWSCSKKRQRFCSHADLKKCPKVNSYGVENEVKKCTNAECYAPVNGHWGRWSDWSSCSKTCDAGIMQRTRQCNDPAPINGGWDCVGQQTLTKACKAKTCSSGAYDCEFYNGGFCGWTNRIDDKIDWTTIVGATRSAGTGPSGDHTSGVGYYAYVEASTPSNYLDNAVLESKAIPAGSKCLTFYYHMYGDNMGKLRVKKKEVATGVVSDLKVLSGNAGNVWKSQKVEITAGSPFKVMFEAEIGTGYKSDIALDDIYIKDCGSAALGMENNIIKNYQVSASSVYDNNHRGYQARLNHDTKWCSNHWSRHEPQFLRVDFEKRHIITAIAVQGHPSFDNWVLTYKIKFTQDSYTISTYKEAGIEKVFSGATDRSTPVKQVFDVAIKTFAVIVNPVTYHGNDICMRIELYGTVDPQQPARPKDCLSDVKPLGMASRLIPDASITESSMYDATHHGYEARLNNHKVWCASYRKRDWFQYVQIDLGKVMSVQDIATQGHPGWANYVTLYQVEYSTDGSMFFTALEDPNSFKILKLTGNIDRNSIVKHKLKTPIVARYIRINPKGYQGHDICLRVELYGCDKA